MLHASSVDDRRCHRRRATVEPGRGPGHGRQERLTEAAPDGAVVLPRPHLVPPTIAHELNYFVDEGLRDAGGQATYELVPDSHAPFMYERLTLWQTMKERGIDVTMDVKPSTIAHLRQQGKEIYVIAGWRNHMPFFVLGPDGTNTLADIAGKRIGVIDLDDILVTMLSYHLLKAGLDPATDVEWVTHIDTR